MNKKTKIVCTIGPASQSIETLVQLLQNGMNVARLNFSHGTHEEHSGRIVNIRKASQLTGIPVAIMLDTKGPEVRTGMLENGSIQLEAGQETILTTEVITGNAQRFTINYAGIIDDLQTGDRILLDDGLIGLEVLELTAPDIRCRVLNSGKLSNRKGVNIPGVALNLPAVSQQDYEDLLFGIAQQVDFIAASFVRSADDVMQIRHILEEHNADIHIVAKIENQQGVDHLEEILAVSDGLMVARGDLGVEIPTERVPLLQKKMIQTCNQAGKPVITATQMLDSMIRNPRPTRAEANDVANAIFDGTDAVMLSGETAAGSYPVEALQTMVKILKTTEEALKQQPLPSWKAGLGHITDAIGYATCTIADHLAAKAIITATESGSTARKVSQYRPVSEILAVTSREKTLRKLLLIWGVTPILGQPVTNTDDMIQDSVLRCTEQDLIHDGDVVILTAGVPVGISGTTNLIKVEVVGKMLTKGHGLGSGSVAGFVRVITQPEDLQLVQEHEILVTAATDATYLQAMQKAKAFVTETAGMTSHDAITALSMNKPIITGAEHITKLVQTGDLITLELDTGIIYKGQTGIQ